MSVLVIHSVHELHQLKKSVAPSPGNFDYKYELTIQYTGFFISYAFTCVLRADAFCLFYNIKNFLILQQITPCCTDMVRKEGYILFTS